MRRTFSGVPHTMNREVSMDFAGYTPNENEPMKEARRLLESYGGKGENELLKAIYDRAVEGKKKGTLTNAQIDEFYAQFSPFVDGAKRKRLKKLVEQLKRM